MRQFTGNPLGDEFEEEDDDSILDLLDYDPEAIRFGPPESDSEDDIFEDNSSESDNEDNNADENYMMDDMSMSPTSVGQIPELLQMALRTIRDTNSDYGDFFEHAHSIETNPPPFPYNVDYSEEESDCDYVSLPVDKEQNSNIAATDQTTSTTSQSTAGEGQPDITKYNMC